MKITVACRKLKINIPSDLKILGVDNEELLCMLAKPTISSMQLQLETLGFTAAKVVDDILMGKDEASKIIYRIPPLNVIERESTSLIDAESSMVLLATSIIKMNLSSVFSVTDLVDRLPCSRRTLEIKFREEKSISLHDYIIDEKLNKANEMLLSTTYSVKVISSECGFGSLQRFHSAFQKKYNTSPAQYRLKNQIRKIST